MIVLWKEHDRAWTMTGCTCGWYSGLCVLVDATLVYKVGLSGTGQCHNDIAGNDLEEIHIVS